jgi:hypothetical protein
MDLCRNLCRCSTARVAPPQRISPARRRRWRDWGRGGCNGHLDLERREAYFFYTNPFSRVDDELCLVE